MNKKIEELFKAYPMNVPPEASEFFEDYKKSKAQKKVFTEKGINVILTLREVNDWITAKSLGEKMDISGRSVSGTMRKLVSDGYVDKMPGSPASYKITEKGMNCDLEQEEPEDWQ